jgi:very-short-patch-repair endonuclease
MHRLAWELARRQHGVVSRKNLLDLGFGPKAIRHRVATGRLHPIHRGVYSVGWPVQSRKQEWMAAVLVCEPWSCLSHHSAGALWKIVPDRRPGVDVTVRRHANLRRAGLRVHVRCRLRPDDVTIRDGIAVTGPARTLLDLATELSRRQLERAVNEADKRNRIDPESLRAALERYAAHPGVRALRALLDEHTFRLSDDELEVMFRPLARSAGLPEPLTKQIVNGFEVDFYWPALGLVVETDGFRYHRTPATQARDALRDQTHTAAGMTALRFSHGQVKYEPRHVRAVLEATAANLRA